MSASPLRPTQQHALRRISELLGSDDAGVVSQGCELLQSLDDRALLTWLLAGSKIDPNGYLNAGTRLRERVQRAHRHQVLLTLMDLDGVERLNFERLRDPRLLERLVELPALRSLRVSIADAVDLRFVEHLPRLESLSLESMKRAPDLTPLRLATALRIFSARRMRLRDLSALRDVQTLEWLILNINPIDDVSPLADLPRLETLDLGQNEALTDVSPLARAPALQRLSLSACAALRDFSPLAEMHALRALDLSDNLALEDLSPLARLHNLRSLELYRCEGLEDLSPLAGLSQLRALDLTDNIELINADAVEGMTGLVSLCLRECEALARIPRLDQLKRLETLDLNSTQGFTDFAALTTLPVLRALDLGAIHVEPWPDLSPLAEISTLQNLTLSHTPIDDLTPIAGLTGLHTLELDGCRNV
ncbi:MAG: leucine-rich repeat domain-containing protein, partial [Myxococcota bacterium]